MCSDKEPVSKSCGPCGVRGTPRFYLSVTFCTLLTLFLVFVATLFIGAEIEGRAMAKANNTDWIYETTQVCATSLSHTITSDSLNNDSMKTFETSQLAADDGYKIAHCAGCGQCSTVIDIEIYNKTKETLTKTATNCATKAFFFGEDGVFECFEEDVGFTSDCNTCWTENVMCDMGKCLFTCLKSVLTGEQNNKQNAGAGAADEGGVTRPPLNNCLLCDEKMCGPAFMRCAGANRRRAGILSDIGRDEVNQICSDVDLDWTTVYNGGI